MHFLHRWQLSLAPGRTQDIYSMQTTSSPSSSSAADSSAVKAAEGSEDGSCRYRTRMVSVEGVEVREKCLCKC
jgi:hypothetical protein